MKVGRASTRRVVVRNNGRRGTVPIAASITNSGAPFSIQGATGGRIEVVLAPKETRTFTIEFEPLAAGPATGSVVIARADGGQPSVSVRLKGVGVESRRRSRFGHCPAPGAQRATCMPPTGFEPGAARLKRPPL